METFDFHTHRVGYLIYLILVVGYSTRGLRIVAACREGLSSIGENQEWLARMIGVEHDAVTRDFARLSFLVPESYFYHYDVAVFTDEPKVRLANQGTGNLRLRPQVTKQESESGWKPVPRFRFPYGSQCHIYNLPVLKLLKPGEELWIAEGCSDCWSLLSSGHKAIAIPSATLLKPKDLEPLLQLSLSACPEPSLPRACRGEGLSFHMFPDADIPGEKLFLQLKAVIPSITRHSLPSDCKDYSDYYLSTLNSQH